MHPNNLWIALMSASLTSARYIRNLPTTYGPGPVNVDYMTPSLDQSDLDAPKLDRVNSTVFDWWYFDAISIDNPNVTVAVTFTSTGPNGAPPPPSYPSTNSTENNNGLNGTESLVANIWVTLPDGRAVVHSAPVSSARVSGSGETTVGMWRGAGSWVGSEEGYEVSLEMGGSGGRGIRGRISLEKITPAHSHCSTPDQFNTSLSLGQGSSLGWVSILPDAVAMVDIDVGGERIQFEGYGYHDKNWSNQPLPRSTKALVRGHAHLGVYTIVWATYLPSNQGGSIETPPISSAFIARDGTPVSAGCQSGSVTVRPVTADTQGGPVSGFQIEMSGATVQVASDVLAEYDALDRHVRYNGRARGMVEGVEVDGVAMFERWMY